jgi:hypothetical protein
MITASPGCYLSLSSATQRPTGRPAQCIRQSPRRGGCGDLLTDLPSTCGGPGMYLATDAGGRSDIEVTCALRPKTGAAESLAPGLGLMPLDVWERYLRSRVATGSWSCIAAEPDSDSARSRCESPWCRLGRLLGLFGLLSCGTPTAGAATGMAPLADRISRVVQDLLERQPGCAHPRSDGFAVSVIAPVIPTACRAPAAAPRRLPCQISGGSAAVRLWLIDAAGLSPGSQRILESGFEKAVRWSRRVSAGWFRPGRSRPGGRWRCFSPRAAARGGRPLWHREGLLCGRAGLTFG